MQSHIAGADLARGLGLSITTRPNAVACCRGWPGWRVGANIADATPSLYCSAVKILKSAKILKLPGRPNLVTAVNSARKILGKEICRVFWSTDGSPTFSGKWLPSSWKTLWWHLILCLRNHIGENRCKWFLPFWGSWQDASGLFEPC